MTWRGIDLLEVCANEVRREHDRVARFDRPLYAITLVGSQNASLSVHIRNNSSSLLSISLLPFFHAKWKHTPFSRNFYPCDFNEMTIFFYNSFFYQKYLYYFLVFFDWLENFCHNDNKIIFLIIWFIFPSICRYNSL